MASNNRDPGTGPPRPARNRRVHRSGDQIWDRTRGAEVDVEGDHKTGPLPAVPPNTQPTMVIGPDWVSSAPAAGAADAAQRPGGEQFTPEPDTGWPLATGAHRGGRAGGGAPLGATGHPGFGGLVSAPGTGPLAPASPGGADSATGPQPTGVPATNGTGVGPLGTGPLATGPLATGPLATGPLTTGPLTTGQFASGQFDAPFGIDAYGPGDTGRAWAPEPDDDHDPAGSPSLVRPYARTGGRTKPARDLDLEALVRTTVNGKEAVSSPLLSPEHISVIDLCSGTISVAEIAARLVVPIGVARVIIADMVDLGLVEIMKTSAALGDERDPAFLRRVLSGLQRL